MTQTTPVDLYSLPEEIVVRFWKNFENAVREIGSWDRKTPGAAHPCRRPDEKNNTRKRHA
jgi:hypothetical protein